MLSFRKKILISDIILFFIFFALLFPFIQGTVGAIAKKTSVDRASEIIQQITLASNEAEMINLLQHRKKNLFFPVSLFDEKLNVLFPQAGVTSQASDKLLEVEDALQNQIGSTEKYSDTWNEDCVFVAKSFLFQGKKYALRLVFPLREVDILTEDFEIAFLTFAIVILLLYGVTTWAILHKFSSPIQKIIDKIRPYRAGKDDCLPLIDLGPKIDYRDDFGKLADTLNSLSAKIQHQIDTLTHKRNENESILDSLVEGIIAVDSRNIVTYANPVACQLLSVDKKKLLQSEFTAFSKSEKKELFSISIQMLKDCQTKGKITTYSTIIEETKKKYLNFIAIPRALKSGAILVMQDKTSDFKLIQVGQEFIANASHELKTPLTIIKGFAETLYDVPTLSKEMQKEIIEKILHTCFRVNALLKNLLRLADIENVNRKSFQKLQLSTIVENAIHNVKEAHPERKILFTNNSSSKQIFVDPDLIDLAVFNLLDNAVKYSQKKSTIDVILTNEKEHMELTIKDEGIGIPEEDLQYIFNRFYTVNKARTRKNGGAGLGLSIVKTILDKHNAQIHVFPGKKKGTTFQVIFPQNLQ